MADPLLFHVDLLSHVANDLSPELPQIHVLLQCRQNSSPPLQKLFPQAENPPLHLGLQEREQPQTQAKRLLRSRIGLGEPVQPLHQRATAPVGERILLARLPALAGNGPLADPAFLEKPPQQRINNVVVQRLLPHHPAGLSLELVSILRPAEQKSEQQ